MDAGLHTLMWLTSLWHVAMVAGFDPKVILNPECPDVTQACVYDWTVTERETMVLYNDNDIGTPVLYDNDTDSFVKRVTPNCNQTEPVNETGNKCHKLFFRLYIYHSFWNNLKE